jgi:myo-inositol-1(or 4)-monophosphatase
MIMDLEKLCGEVRFLCIESGEFIKKEIEGFNTSLIELKGTNDFVSYVDKQSEKKIVERLSELLPDAGFITEENTINVRGKKFEWIIDPLDGTTNFVHGVPCYSISIALRRDEEIILGVIYEVNLQEMFYTWESAASYLNGKEIFVSNKATITESLIATGFPNRNYERMKPYMALLNDLMFTSHGIRRLGSAAVDLAYVACGRFEAFYEYYLSPWDVAAGALIVKNAGGKISDFKGGSSYLFGKEIIATNAMIYNEFLKRLSTHFDDGSN